MYLPTNGQVVLQFKRYITYFQTCPLTYHRLGERSGQREEKGHQPPALVNGGVHHVPRMHRVGGDTMR